MRNKYETILLIATFIGTLALGIVIGRRLEQNGAGFLRLKNNQVSFPFSGTVGVGPDTGSALTSILKKEFGDEYETIMAAAHRNGCDGDNLIILFAIRKAENGPPGNEFGILSQAGTSLDTQAGWAAATIMKNRERWNGEEDFIVFLGNRYCPPSVDPQGYTNWVKNVTYWFEKFKNET